jgi:hypothetical protein
MWRRGRKAEIRGRGRREAQHGWHRTAKRLEWLALLKWWFGGVAGAAKSLTRGKDRAVAVLRGESGCGGVKWGAERALSRISACFGGVWGFWCPLSL